MGKKILIVEDDENSRLLLEEIFRAQNYEDIATAANGLEGLEKVKKVKPDVIISDAMMPEMDGFAFLKRLKNDAATADIPVMIVTVRNQLEDAFRAMNVDSFLPKPIFTDQLLAEVQRIIRRDLKRAVEGVAPAVSDSVAAPPRPPFAPRPATGIRKALVFGQDPDALKGIAAQLEGQNYTVKVVQDDRQIVRLCFQEDFDLIMMQLYLKDENPLDEVIAGLRKALGNKRDIPVIIYKTDDTQGGGSFFGDSVVDIDSLLQRCHDNGCSKYLGMYSSATLLSKLKEWV